MTVTIYRRTTATMDADGYCRECRTRHNGVHMSLHSIRTYPEGYALAYAEFMRKAGFYVEVER